MLPQPRTVLALALTLVACHSPTLWIGELEQDTATPPRRPPAHAEEHDASDANPVSMDAGGQTPPAMPAPMDDAPTAPPPNMRDASVSLPIDDADAGSTSAGDTDPPKPTRLPTVRGRCPELTRSATYTFGDPRMRTLSVDIYIKPDALESPTPRPLILYFHGLGSNPNEVMTGLGQEIIEAVTNLGGVVASFRAKLCASCGLTDDVAWYVEDDAVVDQVVACALEQSRVDPRRIHAMGFSAGAMHSLHLALARSDYIASVISYSGGRINLNAETPQDPSNRVPVLLAYGRVGLDYAGLDFPTLSLQWYDKFKAMGWYTMLCDHQGGHAIPGELVPQAIRFLLDHTYKFEPEMYSGGVPGVFPSYCANVPRRR
jgi:predicted esterase